LFFVAIHRWPVLFKKGQIEHKKDAKHAKGFVVAFRVTEEAQSTAIHLLIKSACFSAGEFNGIIPFLPSPTKQI
jgi:hypothetical protein